MLVTAAMKAMYEASLSVTRGVYVEIGPAQGGSTVSIALGRQAAGRSDIPIYTADVFTSSEALKSSDVATNVEVLKSNLKAFGVGDNVRLVIVPREDIATVVPADAEIGLFFVDADGALDRDFAQFYDRVLPGGHIILDDCEDKLSTKYLDYSARKLSRYMEVKHSTDMADLTPFGKHYTVYKFAQLMIELGLMDEVKTVKNTAFFRKTGDKSYAESGAPAAMAEQRAAIARDFFERRASSSWVSKVP
jgi:predicted O-methyltransferase YrrM